MGMLKKPWLLLLFAVFLAGGFVGRRDAFPFSTLHDFRARVFPAEKPPSRYAFDDLGRLVADDRKTWVACPRQTERSAVLLVLGQSNAANHGGQRFSSSYGPRVSNFFDGQCFVAASPLLGSSNADGELWTEVGNQLVASGKFDYVVVAPVAVSGSEISRWSGGGDLNAALLAMVRQLASSQYRVTQIFWLQGEMDYVLGTSEALYRQRFLSMVDSLRNNNVDAPVYVGVASKCLEASNGGTRYHEPDNPVTRAQRLLPDDARGIKSGPDTDALMDELDRYDDCHFSGSGARKAAQAWAELMLSGNDGARGRFAEEGATID